jgi:hypothetical protein
MAVPIAGIGWISSRSPAANAVASPDEVWPLPWRVLFCLGAALASWAIVIGIALALLAAWRALA